MELAGQNHPLATRERLAEPRQPKPPPWPSSEKSESLTDKIPQWSKSYFHNFQPLYFCVVLCLTASTLRIIWFNCYLDFGSSGTKFFLKEKKLLRIIWFNCHGRKPTI
jgi:hypothetical protein